MDIFINSDLQTAQGIIDLCNNLGITPNRSSDLTPKPSPTATIYTSKSTDYISVFKLYIHEHRKTYIENFKSSYEYGEGDFSSEDKYIALMSRNGSVNFVSDREPKLGCFSVVGCEGLKYYIDLDIDKFSKNAARYIHPDFHEFIPVFENYISDYFDDLPSIESHLAKVDEMAEYTDHSFETCCDFLNEILHIFENGLGRTGRQFHAIRTSQAPFYFSSGKGLYEIFIISKTDATDEWEIIEFLCDH